MTSKFAEGIGCQRSMLSAWTVAFLVRVYRRSLWGCRGLLRGEPSIKRCPTWDCGVVMWNIRCPYLFAGETDIRCINMFEGETSIHSLYLFAGETDIRCLYLFAGEADIACLWKRLVNIPPLDHILNLPRVMSSHLLPHLPRFVILKILICIILLEVKIYLQSR